ncbi:N-6 DNA methylase [Ichthyobacterium seriolicida]|uniref:site-specific DNA-methyltransferase (adenine-specific) n=1 Tax=Ichthyobacterium seriolicida TaxID=242600 RepID=A0A1J1E5U3_9FLAO|nr:N-6 DNA methylase [Ichthyobacterium seriolicida]BAV95428.1 type I restriction-modification system methyltransferase subunit [Ichthyobacterium seriolicida]
MLKEKQRESILSTNLVNNGWNIEGEAYEKNVYFSEPPYLDQQQKLGDKKPHCILYQTGTNKPIAVIEVKKSAKNLDLALKRGMEYAKALDAPLVFAMNGSYCEARFVPNNKELVLNGKEVRGVINEKEVLEFLKVNSNEAWTIPQYVKESREESVDQFKNLNEVLRSEGLTTEVERFVEFSNIMFLKLLYQDDRKSLWDAIKSQPDDRIIDYVNSYVLKQVEDKYGKDIFKPISIKKTHNFRHIINAIDPLVLSTSSMDVKGEVFEYFLEKATLIESDLREYFTPRNIVKTMINLVAPKLKEKIYDPFCGTGGFLVESFNYIKKNNIIKDELDLEMLKNDTFYGREITEISRIAKMNMILNGHINSDIQQINSLKKPDYTQKAMFKGKEIDKVKRFDLVVSSIPFSLNISRKITKDRKTIIENDISPLYYSGIARNSGDAACVLHCLRALKKGGRMALVVPEGFLFRKNSVEVRKFLLSRAKLHSVISLPKGTFLPYTEVKTDILYFTDAHMNNDQENFSFFNTNNIGVTLDNHKRKIKGSNDLKKIESSDIKKVDENPSLQDNILEMGFEIIDLDKVRDNDYNLVGSLYRETKNLSSYPLIKLGDLCHIHTGTTPLRKNEFYWNNGSICWFTLNDLENGEMVYKTKQTITEKALEETTIKLLPVNTVLLSCTATIGKVALAKVPVTTNQQINALIIRDEYKDKILPEFLFYAAKSLEDSLIKISTTQTTKYISSSKLSKVQIPLPPMEEQKKILKSIQKREKEIQKLEQKIGENKKGINQEINKIWESEEETK